MHSHIAQYFDEEDRKRRASLRRDWDLEAELGRMNAHLASLPYRGSSVQKYPTILVFGLPRSGTTLTYQVLANCLDVGYPDNIIARFWDVPWLGVVVSRAILGGRQPCSYVSNYGRTVEPWAPHEFRFFWKRLLRLDSMADHLDFGPTFPRIDRMSLRTELGRLQNAFDAPLLFKSLYFGQFLTPILDAIAMPVVVYVERNLHDVAQSILAARKAYYGSPDVWWSSFCPSYPRLATLPFPEQIANQVIELQNLYEERLAAVDGRLVVRVNYTDLCADPPAVVAAVRRCLRTAYGHDVALVSEPPRSFPQRRARLLDDDARAVARCLDHALARRAEL